MDNSSSLALLCAFALILVSPSVYVQGLDYDYYDNSCKDFEAVVAAKVREWFNKDKTIAPSLTRLHFHDCSVRVRFIFSLLVASLAHASNYSSNGSYNYN